jgi:hypothetical protein
MRAIAWTWLVRLSQRGKDANESPVAFVRKPQHFDGHQARMPLRDAATTIAGRL